MDDWEHGLPLGRAADVAGPLERIGVVDGLLAIGNQSVSLALKQHQALLSVVGSFPITSS